MKTFWIAIAFLFIASSAMAQEQEIVVYQPPSLTILAPSYRMSGDIHFEFLDENKKLLSIRKLENGQYTVILGPDTDWDEAALSFWRILDRFARCNGCQNEELSE